MSAEILRDAAEALRFDATDADADGPWSRLPPALAEALADWLEGVAAWDDEGLGYTDRLNLTNWPSMWGDMQVSALAVARAYLGEQDGDADVRA